MHTNPNDELTGSFVRTSVDDRERRPAEPVARPFDELDERAVLLEHVCRPVGRHGRRLLAEIEAYLDFFAIADAA